MFIIASPACSQLPAWETENEAGQQAFSQGRYAEAQSSFLSEISGEEQADENDLRMVNPISNLAELYMQQGRYLDSEKLYLRVLSIRMNLFGAGDIGSVTTMSNLGAVYFKEGKYSEAELIYKNALDVLLETACAPGTHRKVPS